MIVKDGFKMSKSRGNVVNPDEYIEQYGADTFRLYLMFLGPYTEGGDFRDEGIVGVTRFLQRVWRGTQNATDADGRRRAAGAPPPPPHRRGRRGHRRAALQHRDRSPHGVRPPGRPGGDGRAGGGASTRRRCCCCLAPFAPHITEELWQRTGNEGSVHARGGWPVHDPALAAREEVEVAVQVNGKLRGTLTVPAGTGEDELRQRALRAAPRRRAARRGRAAQGDRGRGQGRQPRRLGGRPARSAGTATEA